MLRGPGAPTTDGSPEDHENLSWTLSSELVRTAIPALPRAYEIDPAKAQHWNSLYGKEPVLALL